MNERIFVGQLEKDSEKNPQDNEEERIYEIKQKEVTFIEQVCILTTIRDITNLVHAEQVKA